MKAIQFFTAQLEAQERFRKALISFKEKFEVNNGETEQGEQGGSERNQYGQGDISGRDENQGAGQ